MLILTDCQMHQGTQRIKKPRPKSQMAPIPIVMARYHIPPYEGSSMGTGADTSFTVMGRSNIAPRRAGMEALRPLRGPV